MTKGDLLLKAVDMVREGSNRLPVMRFAGLTLAQVDELFERCGRNQFGPVFPPEVCREAIRKMKETHSVKD